MLDSLHVTKRPQPSQSSLFGEPESAEAVEPTQPSSDGGSGRIAVTDEQHDLESLKQLLEATGDFKVLRRSGTSALLRPLQPLPTGGVKRGIYLDVETTGLDPADPIIELGMVLFEYLEDGRIVRLVEEFDEFEDPGRPIPTEIVELTGITDEMVAGRSIDDQRVASLAADCDIVIAHNALFDRPIVEKRFSLFASLPWACSVADIDWQRAGMRTRKLEYLAMSRGFFFDSHRAINDCLAGVELLAGRLTAADETTTLANLLVNSRQETVRLWAERSPFESKDLLKERRYRWNPDAKLWWRDLVAGEHEAELEWLEATVYRRRHPLPYYGFDATSRYSRRLPLAPTAHTSRR